jgi:hypothetical protein
MIRINIPGFRDLQLVHLVLDYNGTLAVDGKVLRFPQSSRVWSDSKAVIKRQDLSCKSKSLFSLEMRISSTTALVSRP